MKLPGSLSRQCAKVIRKRKNNQVNKAIKKSNQVNEARKRVIRKIKQVRRKVIRKIKVGCQNQKSGFGNQELVERPDSLVSGCFILWGKLYMGKYGEFSGVYCRKNFAGRLK